MVTTPSELPRKVSLPVALSMATTVGSEDVKLIRLGMAVPAGVRKLVYWEPSENCRSSDGRKVLLTTPLKSANAMLKFDIAVTLIGLEETLTVTESVYPSTDTVMLAVPLP